MQTAIEELEGRVNAQRELMISMLAVLLADGKMNALQDLDEQTSPSTGDEDPGLEPSRAFAVAGATAEEIRLIVEAARARAAASAPK